MYVQSTSQTAQQTNILCSAQWNDSIAHKMGTTQKNDNQQKMKRVNEVCVGVSL